MQYFSEYHPSHDLELENDLDNTLCCKNCGKTDSHSTAGDLMYPCGQKRIGGPSPLSPDVDEQLSFLLNYIDKNYDLRDGLTITSLYWQFSSDLARALYMKKNEK